MPSERGSGMEQLTSGGSLAAIIADSIRRFGARPMISDDQKALTYAELGELIGRFGSLYRSIGLSKGDGVGLLTGNRVETWAAICAAAVFGLRFTPLHPLAGEEDHVHVIGDAELDVLFFDAEKFGARASIIKSRLPSLNIFSFGASELAQDALAILEGLGTSLIVPIRKTWSCWPIPAERQGSPRASCCPIAPCLPWP